MRRSELREHIFKLLFLADFYPLEQDEEQTSLYLEGLGEISGEDEAYIRSKYARIREMEPLLDERLNRISEGWRTRRMNRVDLMLLRLALFEMDYDTDVPVGVAINEAVELAKRFGGDESGSFVNGLLGRAARESEKREAT